MHDDQHLQIRRPFKGPDLRGAATYHDRLQIYQWVSIDWKQGACNLALHDTACYENNLQGI